MKERVQVTQPHPDGGLRQGGVGLVSAANADVGFEGLDMGATNVGDPGDRRIGGHEKSRELAQGDVDRGDRLRPQAHTELLQIPSAGPRQHGSGLGHVCPVGFVAAAGQRLPARMRSVGLAAMEQHRVQPEQRRGRRFRQSPPSTPLGGNEFRTPHSISIRGDGGRGGRGDHGYLGEFGPHLGDLELVESELARVAAKRQRGGRVTALVMGTPFRRRPDDIVSVDVDPCGHRGERHEGSHVFRGREPLLDRSPAPLLDPAEQPREPGCGSPATPTRAARPGCHVLLHDPVEYRGGRRCLNIRDHGWPPSAAISSRIAIVLRYSSTRRSVARCT